MDSASSNSPYDTSKKNFEGFRLAGCCTGTALGCGFSFIFSWAFALLFSALLAPLFGKSGGGNTIAGVMVSGLTCGSSLIIGACLSFLTGRLFPVFKKKKG